MYIYSIVCVRVCIFCVQLRVFYQSKRKNKTITMPSYFPSNRTIYASCGSA